MKNEYIALWVALALLLSLGLGCAGESAEQPSPATNPLASAVSTSPPAPTPAASATPAPTAGTPVPVTASPTAGAVPHNRASDFRFTLFQGEDVLGASEMALSELEPKPIVLNFWARFCTPCWSEMPELQEFYEEYEDRVLLIGVDVGQFTGFGSPKDPGRLLDALGITYPAGFTDEAAVVRDYGIRAMPTTAFITADGEIFQVWTGSITREQVTAITRRMLSEE